MRPLRASETLRPSPAPTPRGFLLLLLLTLVLLSPPALSHFNSRHRRFSFGAASVASRPQGRELALKKERRVVIEEELGEGDMLLLPSQTVDPAATATPYSDATQVGFLY